MKRLFDMILAIIVFIIAIPLMFFAFIGIKLSSPSPVIYKAKRIGKYGKVFTLYKFRTMNVESGSVHVTTLKNDIRVFPFGKILRQSKIDELPQLVNIFLNQMSVVGPRPEDLDIAKEIYVGEYLEILNIKPGLTSIASLYDYTHGELCVDENEYVNKILPNKLKLELYYVKNNSLKNDLRIVLKTAYIIMLTMFGIKNFDEPKELKSKKAK